MAQHGTATELSTVFWKLQLDINLYLNLSFQKHFTICCYWNWILTLKTEEITVYPISSDMYCINISFFVANCSKVLQYVLITVCFYIIPEGSKHKTNEQPRRNGKKFMPPIAMLPGLYVTTQENSITCFNQPGVINIRHYRYWSQTDFLLDKEVWLA